MNDKIIIRGAKEHNLKNVDLTLPRDKFIVFTGLSGSGKSSLAFDTIYAEGQRRYVESLSAYARQFLGQMEKPNVEYIEGLSPAISIDQKTTSKNPRSTVGTVTEIYDYLRLLYARCGVPYCPNHNIPITSQSIEEMTNKVLALGAVDFNSTLALALVFIGESYLGVLNVNCDLTALCREICRSLDKKTVKVGMDTEAVADCLLNENRTGTCMPVAHRLAVHTVVSILTVGVRHYKGGHWN